MIKISKTKFIVSPLLLSILVEHAIGGVKRFRALTDGFRNKRKNLDDQIILVAAGIWNLHYSLIDWI